MKRSLVELSEVTESDEEISTKNKKGPEKSKKTSINSLKGNKVLTATEVENINDSSSDSEKSKGDKDASNMPEPEKLRDDDRKIRVKSYKPFTDELLSCPEGLMRIHDEFPRVLTYHGRGSEANYIKRLVTLYKEWAFQLHPGITFNDLLMKCESLGNKAPIRNYIQRLREKERSRYMTEVLGLQSWSNPVNEDRSKEVPTIQTEEPVETSTLTENNIMPTEDLPSIEEELLS
mmetsp:Transcript_33147/g.47952  ORF Transcript_33147/g.47952 Transcript_33147/m.47952 type:complete len:233 (+) Transcript_33147:19-717(+)